MLYEFWYGIDWATGFLIWAVQVLRVYYRCFTYFIPFFGVCQAERSEYGVALGA
jgi:hypothetical protein